MTRRYYPKPAMRRNVVSMVAACGLLLAGAAHATLQDRDLDGNGQTDAFYDTDLDVTWLRNANVNGLMDWSGAMAWAGSFTFAGYGGWRLPTSDACQNYNCTGGEMGHLWYVELGNVAGSMTNTGGFQNLQADFYWSGTELTADPYFAYAFDAYDGWQVAYSKTNTDFAMLVRPGDVPPVPEPATVLLWVAGLMAVGARRRSTAWRDSGTA